MPLGNLGTQPSLFITASASTIISPCRNWSSVRASPRCRRPVRRDGHDTPGGRIRQKHNTRRGEHRHLVRLAGVPGPERLERVQHHHRLAGPGRAFEEHATPPAIYSREDLYLLRVERHRGRCMARFPYRSRATAWGWWAAVVTTVQASELGHCRPALGDRVTEAGCQVGAGNGCGGFSPAMYGAVTSVYVLWCMLLTMLGGRPWRAIFGCLDHAFQCTRTTLSGRGEERG